MFIVKDGLSPTEIYPKLLKHRGTAPSFSTVKNIVQNLNIVIPALNDPYSGHPKSSDELKKLFRKWCLPGFLDDQQIKQCEILEAIGISKRVSTLHIN